MAIACMGLPAGPADMQKDAGAEQQRGRKVREVGYPIGPAGDKAMHIAKRRLRPQVQATFAGHARTEFDHRQRQRNEEAD